MVFGISTYTDPGVYQQEVIVPSGVNIPAQPFAVCLVGTGSRNKRVNNEPVVRGGVKGEVLTVAGSAPHTATLANRGAKIPATTVLYKTLNGIRSIVLANYFSYNAPFVIGTVSTPVDLTTATAANAIALEMDGIPAVTIVLTSTGASTSAGSPTFSAATFVGREIHVTFTATTGSTVAAIPISDVAAGINFALSSAATLGYGSTYASVATPVGGFLQLTSPNSGSTSDVRVFNAYAHSGTTAIFGGAGPSNRDAQTAITISNLVWNSSATWTIDYAKITGNLDPLAQTSNVQDIVSVGASPGGTNFQPAVDWNLTSNQVDWSPDTAAVVTGVAGLGGSAPDKTFDVSTNNLLVLGFDGLISSLGPATTDISVTLSGSPGSPPLGYAAPVSAAAALAAELANNINAYLAASLGPRFDSVASVVLVNGTNRVRLTSPIVGQAQSSIYVHAAATLSAHTTVFGGVVDPPAMGTGKKPVPGSTYYVTYDYTRSATDYDVPMRFFSVEEALAQVGNPSVITAGYNPLGISSQIAFENGAQFIYIVQVNDTLEGNPTRAQVKAALDGAGTVAGTTEIVVVGEPGTRLDVTTDEVDHLETQCGPIEKHYRRIFNAMPNGTAIGDSDTPNSLVGRATNTLQVSPSSPGRGRMFVIAPPQQAGVTRNLTLEDGTSARVALDTTYMAVAVAAARTALAGPAETLTNRTITGFNTDDITAPWAPGERRTMAGQGVLVITYDAGRFLIRDALTTEAGGGGLVQFQVDSTSYQKDVITTQVNQALDENIVGIVPFDLASFILDIKLVIQGVIAAQISKGTIGPFRDLTTGATRSIDLRTDIRVAQNVNDPTSFSFSYFYMLRYPALRLFGQYSVDTPFFALNPAA